LLFQVNKNSGLYKDPNKDSQRLKVILAGGTVKIEDLKEQELANPVLAGEWLKVIFIFGTLNTEGWVEKDRIDLDTFLEIEPEAFEGNRLELFVRDCIRNEFLSREQVSIDGEASFGPTILGDFLIALALYESDLSNVTTQIPGTDAIGPFQITSTDWKRWTDSDEGTGAKEEHRFRIASQVRAAQYLVRQDWIALVKMMTAHLGAQSHDTFVPSFLNLLHARTLGVKAAFAINLANMDPDVKNDNLKDILAGALDANGLSSLMEQRQKVLVAKPGAAELSVNGFFLTSSETLSEHLTRAFSLLKEHAEEFVKLPTLADTPWMDIAEQELDLWKRADVTETSAKGAARIVDDYFGATDLPVNKVEPWCGAFAAYCLATSGNAVAVASVFPGAARAASWKTWGTDEIRVGSIKKMTDAQLRGAVVVLHPGEGTGSSGHVCFAVGRPTKADKIECIGGNQSDTVRKSTYALSRVAAVRVLTVPETDALEDGDITAETVDLVKGFEGLRLESYQDDADVWTIGYGTTSRAGIGVTVGPGQTINEATAETYLAKGLGKFAAEIKPAINADYTSNQFGAMLSLAYNIGSSGFKGSTCLREFNLGNLDKAADAILLWNKVKGKLNNGLVNRRQKEREYFLNG